MLYTQQELGPLEEDLLSWILREVLKALDYLHSRRIAYGNMSTHHILFSVSSGSLEVKLDHTHGAIDGLDARAGSEREFNHNLKVACILQPNYLNVIMLHALVFLG